MQNHKSHKLRSRQIKSGIIWSILNVTVNKGAGILIRLLLARLLMPEQFGLIAMIVVYLGIFKLIVDLGIKNTLIQKPRDKNSLLQYDSVFWFLAANGFVWSTVFIFAITPLMVFFYGEENLRGLSQVMGVSILLCSISIIPEVRLVRRMKFRQLTMAEMLSTLISSVIAVGMAWHGYGVWSLVALQISAEAIRSAAIWNFAKWHPRRRYSWKSIRELLNNSKYMLGNQILYYLRFNMDKLIIGLTLGASSLGVYSLAYLLTETLRTQVGAVVGRVMFPAYSRLQNNKIEIGRLYLKTIKLMSLVGAPVSCAIYFNCELLIVLLLDKSWFSAITITKTLSIATGIISMYGDPGSVLKGIGRPKTAFRIYLINSIGIGAPAILIGALYMGINGAALGIVAQALTGFFLFGHTARNEIGVSFSDTLRALLPATFSSAIVILISIAANTLIKIN